MGIGVVLGGHKQGLSTVAGRQAVVGLPARHAVR